MEKDSFWVTHVTSREQALALFENQFFHLCLWSVEPQNACEELSLLRGIRSESALIVTSQMADPAFIVSCIRTGASHFWVKGQDLGILLGCIRETLARYHFDGDDGGQMTFPFEPLVGRHPSIQQVYRLILKIKDTDTNVLITGESGTGKELVAKAIHTLGNRKKYPWVAVNCGAIPATLLESELFGHVKGAFTGAVNHRQGRFQLAGNGTLFLDEIADLNFDLQAKLLRAIQNRIYEPVGSTQSLTLNARIIAATNQDLEEAVAEKRFREDLFYRLNVIPISMPNLRSRKSDIPMLAKNFIDHFSQINQRSIHGISEEALQCLMEYHWPGNIRELENLIERVVVLKEKDGVIEIQDFPVGYFKSVRLDRFVANVAVPDEGLDFNSAVNEFENELILQALKKTSGNKNRAATLLRLNRTTLVEKLKRKGLVL